jgi:SAM-dependent methyltransferase
VTLIDRAHAFAQRVTNALGRRATPQAPVTRSTVWTTNGYIGPDALDSGYEAWHDLLPFTTHRIRLQADRYTMAAGVEPEDDVRCDVVVDVAGGSLAGKSVLDLGCLEGGFALELARRGAARVLGIEFREISVQRCELARDLMALPNAEFICGDIMTAIPAEQFDVVFATGILYHLDRPAELLAIARRACRGFMMLDTHVARRDEATHGCGPEAAIEAANGTTYRGRWFTEFAESTTAASRARMLWASSTNHRSFWPFQDELERMLHDAGFGDVTQADPDPKRWNVDLRNRVMYLCRP